MNIFLANSFLTERLTASTKREFLSITILFWASAEKLSLIHPSATLLAKHMSSQQHLVHHHAASALVSPFSVDSVEPTTLLNHFDLSPFPFPNPLGWSCGQLPGFALALICESMVRLASSFSLVLEFI
jgi:hypothetical protein